MKLNLRRPVNLNLGWLLLVGVALVAPAALLGSGATAIADEAPQAATTAVAVQPTDKPFLWAIRGEHGKHSFLYGTIHLPVPEVLAIPEVVQRAHATADRYYAELPMEPAVKLQVQAALVRTDGKSLLETLPPDVAQRADAYLQKRHVQLTMLQNVSTFAASSFLALADQLQAMQTTPGLDDLLYKKAQDDGKTVGGLETPDEQIAIFTAFPEPDQVHLFARTLEYCEKADAAGEPVTRKMIKAYVAGDPEELQRVMFEYLDPKDPVEAAAFKKLITDRNEVMAERIEKQLKENSGQSLFFAVGAAHLVGDDGLVKKLEGKGYKIRRLTPSDAAKIKAP